MLNFENLTKNQFYGITIITSIIVTIIVITIYIHFIPKIDKFISGATLTQLMAKDSQDLNLNGNEIYPYTTSNFIVDFNQPNRTSLINRGDPTISNKTSYLPMSHLSYEYIQPYYDIMQPFPVIAKPISMG